MGAAETDVCVPDLGLSLVNKVEQSWIWIKQIMQTARDLAKEEDLAQEHWVRIRTHVKSVLDANETEYPLGRIRLDSDSECLSFFLSRAPWSALAAVGRGAS